LPDPAPLLGTPEAPIPPGAAAEWLEGAGGARLRAARFAAAGPPRGTVVLSGGRTEPIEKYFEVASELTGRGFVVLAHDWRGQGLSQRLLSEPLKGHAAGADDFIADYRALLDAFETRAPSPWLAIGHSMGGCLTALAIARGEARLAAAVLCAPMFGIFTRPLAPALARALAAGLAAAGLGALLTPGGALHSPPTPFAANVLTHDPARYARSQAQLAAHPELALGPPTWGWLAFAFAATGELAGSPGPTRAAIPVTAVAAGDDRLVDDRATRAVIGRFPRGRYVEVAGAFHEILQETDALRAVFWREFDSLADAAAPS